MGDLCPSGVDMRLINGTRCQSNQVLTNTITRKGSKRLVVVHKLQQAHFCGRGVRDKRTSCKTCHAEGSPGWIGCRQGFESHSLRSRTRSHLLGRSAVAGLRCQQQGSERSWPVQGLVDQTQWILSRYSDRVMGPVHTDSCSMSGPGCRPKL